MEVFYFAPAPGDSHIFYAADDPGSVWYDGSEDEVAASQGQSVVAADAASLKQATLG